MITRTSDSKRRHAGDPEQRGPPSRTTRNDRSAQKPVGTSDWPAAPRARPLESGDSPPNIPWNSLLTRPVQAFPRALTPGTSCTKTVGFQGRFRAGASLSARDEPKRPAWREVEPRAGATQEAGRGAFLANVLPR